MCLRDKCLICNEEKSEYEYVLNDGIKISIGDKCGKILYGKNIGINEKQSQIQLIKMIEYIKNYHEETCYICGLEKGNHEYNLIGGMKIPLGNNCHSILNGKNIGSNEISVQYQLIKMIEYVKFMMQVEEFKHLEFLNSIPSLEDFIKEEEKPIYINNIIEKEKVKQLEKTS